MNRSPRFAIVFVTCTLGLACGPHPVSMPPDAGPDHDGGAVDAGPADGGGPVDGGVDSGEPDSGTPDSGEDAGADGSVADGGTGDGGSGDGGTGDGGTGDGGNGDAGTTDGGPADAGDAGAIDGGPTIIVGAPGRILLIGTIVTPDQVIEGEVLVEGTTITCVAAGQACEATDGGAGATIIDTKGIISPGLIDTHNHILFDIFNEDDWSPTQTYVDHNAWTSDARYVALLDVKQCLDDDPQGKPAWCANTTYGTAAGSIRCEMDKFGELKGLIAGTTSIVGLPGTSSACFGSLSRSIDVSQNGLGQDKIQTSAIFPPSKANADSVCANFAAGSTTAYLIHCGEGTNAASLNEFQTLNTVSTVAGCLVAPQTTITHGTAFGFPEFSAMADAGTKLTWSPRSNVFLYGQTADIPTALDAGVTVALAPDWSIGGSQNMLDELRFADAWDNTHWNDVLSPQDLVVMATKNASQVVAFDDKLGRIEVGYLADLAVFAGDGGAPYDAIIEARPKDVTLVMVGGVVLYGDPVLQAVAPAQPGCELLDICGTQKFLCVATTATTSKLNQTYADISSTLETGLEAADLQTPTDGWSFAPLAPLVKCQ